ncbi:hypothetical protein IFR04_009700 [Cadophora malorum]|uniref:Uncharacterized protein n=1 Tax=Cadophora malorum TaxID=108018 RepID=A0A8H7TCK0_9HELO|nr:hypothetical protein IFR04_009700 [Cadophora malorum]
MPSKKQEEKRREKKKEENPQKKTVFGPVPPCKASDCPIKASYSQGIYLHEGNPATKYWETPVFGKSNPPPEMKRTGKKKSVFVQPVPPPSDREGRGPGGSVGEARCTWVPTMCGR